jgi:hypothetical protein
MPPLGEYPRCIAPAAAMVDDLKKKKNTNKTQLLPSILTVDRHKKAIKSQVPPEPLLTSLARQAPTITLTLLDELNSSATFSAIK